jgi:heat shock protein beta
MGYTANMERMMSEFPICLGNVCIADTCVDAQNNKKQDDLMMSLGKRQRVIELNPKSPLIEGEDKCMLWVPRPLTLDLLGLLRRVEQLPGPDEEKDVEAEDELKEVISVLIDGTLVRSGFEVPDSHTFLTRVDRVLRRSLGVSETAETDTTVAPAPPVDPTVEEEAQPGITLPDDLKDKLDITMEEVDENNNPIHDEL